MQANSYGVVGMTCAHCVASVTDEVGRIDGADSVSVRLVVDGVSLVTVTSGLALDRAAVAAAIEEAGYQLVSDIR